MVDTENSIQDTGIPEIELAVAQEDTPVLSLGVNASETVSAPIDSTLNIAGMAADAGATGDGIRQNASDIAELQQSDSRKVNKPTTRPDGNAGQVLQTNGDGTTTWVNRNVPTDEQTAQAVNDWLDEHPEATTTVEDGSVTYAKLNPGVASVAETLEYIGI